MMEHYLRPALQKWAFDPAAKLFKGVHPNVMTGLSLVCGLLCAITIVQQHLFIAIAWLLLSGFFDVLDGSIARLLKQSSPKGAVLDIVSDRVVEIAIMLALFAIDPVARSWPVLLMLSTTFLCVTTFLVVGMFTKNKSEKTFHYSRGLIERPEAFVFFVLMIAFPAYFMFLAFLYSVLVLLTAVLRLYSFLRNMTDE
jgi:archaetidylinositol phosphate synthase